MRIVAEDAKAYTLLCDRGHRFHAYRPVFTFECPACGMAAIAVNLLADWVLRADRPPPTHRCRKSRSEEAHVQHFPVFSTVRPR